MGYKVDNAIIMAAGASSRFAPLSYEYPKALITVKGEVLIERQIRQLREAGIQKIIIVVGYMKEYFNYLKDKFGVIIVENNDYNVRNNNSTIYAARNYLGNSYICSADNYFTENPFESEVDDAYYAAVYADGETNEWCISDGDDGYIDSVVVGGRNSWVMMGHTFWTEEFSRRFSEILLNVYNNPETAGMLWESIYMNNLDTLKMRIRKYRYEDIYEFDSLDELRIFDTSYINNSHSVILKKISSDIGCTEGELKNITALKDPEIAEAVGFTFYYNNIQYEYNYKNEKWRKI